jgi:hypothetical protein
MTRQNAGDLRERDSGGLSRLVESLLEPRF